MRALSSAIRALLVLIRLSTTPPRRGHFDAGQGRCWFCGDSMKNPRGRCPGP